MEKQREREAKEAEIHRDTETHRGTHRETETSHQLI